MNAPNCSVGDQRLRAALARFSILQEQAKSHGLTLDVDAEHRAIHAKYGSPISPWLSTFLRTHEAYVRQLAADEAKRGVFTVGLSRCLDILDDQR